MGGEVYVSRFGQKPPAEIQHPPLGVVILPCSASGRLPQAFPAWSPRRARALPDVGGYRYGAVMADQPGLGEGSPSPGRKAPGGPPTPHDAVFRRVFGVPANAASQLRAVLPPSLAGRLDLGRLARVPGSFVDEALRWRHISVIPSV